MAIKQAQSCGTDAFGRPVAPTKPDQRQLEELLAQEAQLVSIVLQAKALLAKITAERHTLQQLCSIASADLADHAAVLEQLAVLFDQSMVGPQDARSAEAMAHLLEARSVWLLAPGLRDSYEGWLDGMHAKAQQQCGSSDPSSSHKFSREEARLAQVHLRKARVRQVVTWARSCRSAQLREELAQLEAEVAQCGKQVEAQQRHVEQLGKRLEQLQGRRVSVAAEYEEACKLHDIQEAEYQAWKEQARAHVQASLLRGKASVELPKHNGNKENHFNSSKENLYRSSKGGHGRNKRSQVPSECSPVQLAKTKKKRFTRRDKQATAAARKTAAVDAALAPRTKAMKWQAKYERQRQKRK